MALYILILGAQPIAQIVKPAAVIELLPFQRQWLAKPRHPGHQCMKLPILSAGIAIVGQLCQQCLIVPTATETAIKLTGVNGDKAGLNASA